MRSIVFVLAGRDAGEAASADRFAILTRRWRDATHVNGASDPTAADQHPGSSKASPRNVSAQGKSRVCEAFPASVPLRYGPRGPLH
jgi:hypothetical protein